MAAEVGDRFLSAEVFGLVVALLLDPPLHPDAIKFLFAFHQPLSTAPSNPRHP
jgi:hypothetical protein